MVIHSFTVYLPHRAPLFGFSQGDSDTALKYREVKICWAQRYEAGQISQILKHLGVCFTGSRVEGYKHHLR